MFFDSAGNPRIVPNSRGKKRRPGTKDLQMALRTGDSKFIDFLNGCLLWDPRERFRPDDALQHEWILDGYTRYTQQSSSARGENRENDGSRSHKRVHASVYSARTYGPSSSSNTHQVSGGTTVFPPIEQHKKADICKRSSYETQSSLAGSDETPR